MELGFIGWFFLSIAVGIYAANHRGRSAFGWFVLSVLISPLIAFILVFVMQDKRGMRS